MPAPIVDTEDVSLEETEKRYLESKKPSTARIYRSSLRRFKVYYPEGIPGLIRQIEEDTEGNKEREVYDRIRPGEDVLRGFVKWQEEKGYSPNSMRLALAAIQNCLKYYGITVSYDFITLPQAIPLDRNKKHQWTIDQIKKFVESAEYLREKAFIMFAFQSGLGIGDILDLNYGDIRREYEEGVLPLAVEGYRKKTGVPLRTFIGRDTVKLLRLYLESRPGIQSGDPLFTLLGSSERANQATIQKQLRKYAEKLNFIYDEDLENGFNPARPHSLRSGFRSRLTGKMDGDLIEFFMAHDIGQHKSTYINMPLEDLREIYASYEHLLSIEKTSRDEKAEGSHQVTEAAFRSLERKVGSLERRNSELETEVRLLRETQREFIRQEIEKALLQKEGKGVD
jgi:integrase